MPAMFHEDSMTAPRLARAVASLSAVAVLLSTFFALPAAATQDPAISAAPVPPPNTTSKEVPDQAQSRFVVKFKTAASGNATARAKIFGQAARASRTSVKELRTTATGAVVIQASESLTTADRASVVASLRSQSNVESVEPDTFVRPAATVSDPLYPYQWDYSESTAGMRVPGAWDVTTGQGATVAVIDTGITVHSDLAANVVPGYDFISDPGISNDGDARDPDATDVGDYCNGAPSSWHGTHVAGTVAAVGNNGLGLAGVAYGAKVQPLRALGACGGYMSDIADAVVWAAGGTVAGLPANPTPARVINMSLGGFGQCADYVQSSLDFAAAQGAVVVAAAGNENSPTSGSTPANCDKVITVGATGREGNRAFYSNYGPEVDVSAPGGDATASGYNAILSTWNEGETTVGSEAYGFMQGTSMAAPHVAALAALMMTAGSSLTPAEVESKMKATARPIPGLCDTGGCGTGLVDAGAAVRAAMPAIIAGTPSIVGSPWLGQTLSVQEGTWSPTSGFFFSYQWLRDGNPIFGATERNYKVIAADEGSLLSVEVDGYSITARRGASATSQPIGPITAGQPIGEPTPVPGLTIAPAPSETPAPDPSPTESIAPEPSISIAPAPSDSATAEPTPTETAGPVPSESPTPEPGPTETIAPEPSYVPTISGEARVGSTLTAQPAVRGFVSTYEWHRNGSLVDLANSQTYVPGPSDIGQRLSVRVVTITESLEWVDGTSAATEPVAEGALAAPKPTITGSPVVGQALSAAPGTWSGNATLSYQWHKGGAAIPTAQDETYAVKADDLGAPLTVRVTGTAPGYAPLTVESDATAPVGTGVLTGPVPTITGTAAVGQTLSAVAGSWTPNTMMSYQWYQNGTAVPGATTASFTLSADDLSKNFTVVVTGTQAGFTPLAVASAPTGAVARGTLSGLAPTLATTGTIRTYDIVSAAFDAGQWTPGASLRGQWYASGVPIPDATATDYEVKAAEVGKTLSYRVVASKDGYETTAVATAESSPVQLRPIALGTPVITGTVKVGYTLTSSLPSVLTPGKIGSPMTPPYQFQWFRSGVAVVGATARGYTLTSSDLGKAMSVRVTVDLKYGWEKQSQSSAPTSAVAAGTLTAAVPTISGIKKVGYALTAASGAWTVGTTLKYQWYRSGVAIVGATGSKYTVVAADHGKSMKVRVTGTKSGYVTLAKDSVSTTAVVAGTLTAPSPWISGTPRYGYILTANSGTWTAGTTLRYQWYRSGVAIAGATGKWYRLVAADRYDTVRARVVGSKAGYVTVTKYSGSTVRIP